MTSQYVVARRVLRAVYHIIPSRIRELSLFERVSGTVSRKLKILAQHEEIYTDDYYRYDVEQPAAFAAPIIARSILAHLKPKRVIDVGCGTGALLKIFAKSNCTCLGLEYSEAGLKMCRERGLDVRKFNLEHDCVGNDVEPFDVAISMEVAEHLPARCADRFIDLLTSLAPLIVFTAATPGQGGEDHVNEQPQEYWVEKFKARNYQHHRNLAAEWSRVWKNERVPLFYHANLMVFSRE